MAGKGRAGHAGSGERLHLLRAALGKPFLGEILGIYMNGEEMASINHSAAIILLSRVLYFHLKPKKTLE